MKNIMKRLLTLSILIPFSIFAPHGGGHHGGGHRGGGGGHHAGHHEGHHGEHGYHGGRGFGVGVGAGLVGASLVNGAFHYSGRPSEYWQENDPEYYNTVVLPAQKRYQANPELLEEDTVMDYED